jgi:hypothetical protein
MNEMLESALKYREMGLSIFPVNPKDKRPAIASWLKYQKEQPTIAEVNEWFGKNKHQGIAIVTGKISKLFVVDFDKYKPEYSEENALKYFPDTLKTAMVKTINNGQHLYFNNPPGDISIKASVLPGIDYRGEGGYVVAPPTKNLLGRQYEWVVPLEEGLADLPLSFINIIKRGVIGGGCSNHVVNDTTRGNNYYKLLQDGHRDDDLFRVGMCLADGHCNRDYIGQVLEILALNSNPAFPLSEVESKIRSVLDRLARKERNLADEVREWILLQEGNFLTTDIQQTLHITTKEEKKNLTVILSRLCNDGNVIEKHGDKRGSYRTKTINIEAMDLLTEEANDEIDIKLPINLNDMWE